MKDYYKSLNLLAQTLDEMEWSEKNASYVAELLRDIRIEFINVDLVALAADGIY